MLQRCCALVVKESYCKCQHAIDVYLPVILKYEKEVFPLLLYLLECDIILDTVFNISYQCPNYLKPDNSIQ